MKETKVLGRFFRSFLRMSCERSDSNGAWNAVVDAADRLPPFSPVLHRLLSTLADEDSSLGELAVLIEKDAVLAGNVLRLVNSSLYGRRGTVNSVRHAVSLMGVTKLRNFGLGFSISQMWVQMRMPQRWSSRSFNLHSVAVAIVADLTAIETSVPYAEGAFVAGLLHDIGKLVIAIAFPGDFDALYSQDAAGPPAEECERARFGFTHCDVSGAVLHKWNLPQPIQRAVAHHHWPDEANGGQLHLAHVVAAADAYLNHSGFTIVPEGEGAVPPSTEALEKIGLGARIPEVLASCQSEFEALTGFFS